MNKNNTDKNPKGFRLGNLVKELSTGKFIEVTCLKKISSNPDLYSINVAGELPIMPIELSYDLLIKFGAVDIGKPNISFCSTVFLIAGHYFNWHEEQKTLSTILYEIEVKFIKNIHSLQNFLFELYSVEIKYNG